MEQKTDAFSPVKRTLTKKELDKMRAEDREIVRGIFRFHEVPGGTLSFPFKKYKGDEVIKYTLVDGEVYSLPLGVAMHLNNNCWYPLHDYTLDENGRQISKYKVSRKVRRCSFQSLDFIDVEGLTPVGEATIYTAEKIGSR